MGYVDGTNLVEYVWDSPTNRLDPSGMQAWPGHGYAPIHDDLKPGSTSHIWDKCLEIAKMLGPGTTAVDYRNERAGETAVHWSQASPTHARARIEGGFYADRYSYGGRHTIKRALEAEWIVSIPFTCTVDPDTGNPNIYAHTDNRQQVKDIDEWELPTFGGGQGVAFGMGGSYSIHINALGSGSTHDDERCQYHEVTIRARWIKTLSMFGGLSAGKCFFRPGGWGGEEENVLATEDVHLETKCCCDSEGLRFVDMSPMGSCGE